MSIVEEKRTETLFSSYELPSVVSISPILFSGIALPLF